MVREKDDHQDRGVLEILERVGLPIDSREGEVGRSVANVQVMGICRHLALEIHLREPTGR
jgi:hypothetical protein